MKKTNELRIIKKYQNRRLYDTATSTYIILEDIKQMIIEGDLVKVIDVKSDKDVTRSVLLQIILDEEANSTPPIFSNEFLLQIIKFYGKAFQPAISPFLEQGIDMLKQTQKKFYAQLKNNSKENIGSNFEAWKEFWTQSGTSIQQNIFEYLSLSTANFLQMQEQISSQTENIMNIINFPFIDKSK